MSIIMHLYYTGTDGSARRFAEEMERSGIAQRVRQEPGNVGYAYYLSLSDPETVLLVDAWRDQEALDVHHASPVMEEISHLREKYDLHMRAERCVEDAAGISAEDSKFLRK